MRETSSVTGTTNTASIAPDAMTREAFIRSFELRGSQIMWFLGAGTSHSAGVMTAREMIRDLQRRLYYSRSQTPPAEQDEASEQSKIQSYFDALGRFPSPDAKGEYSAYFEEAFPLAMDRRLYIDWALTNARPSLGHLVLALFMREGMSHLTWTTNFDRLIEDGAARIYGSTSNLTMADLSEPKKLSSAISEARWPVLGKLHGDFQSERLKNTGRELMDQDKEIRAAFVNQCVHRGLAVVGYSGRDDSVLDALHEALNLAGFPQGLFWLNRRGDTLNEGVTALLASARACGVQACEIEIDSFDSLMLDLAKFLPIISAKLPEIQVQEPAPPGPTRMPASARTSEPEPIKGVSGLVGGGLPQFRNDQFQNFCKSFDTKVFYVRSVLMLDVDRLTQINDHFGFEAGNDILSAISVLLNAHLADGEYACRCGDDTFCVLAASAGDKSEARMTEALALIERYPWTSIDPNLSVECSAGIVGRGENEPLDHAIVRAGIGMQQAKKRDGAKPGYNSTVKSARKKRKERIKEANALRKLRLLPQLHRGPRTLSDDINRQFGKHWS